MAARSASGQTTFRADPLVRWVIIGIEYAIVVSLLLVAGIVLLRTVVDFLSHWRDFPTTVVAAIDGILVVIILLDIANTVFGHLRTSSFPIRPFLVIGILAGVRDILSASAHLTLSTLSRNDFNDTLISLGVGVGVVVFLLGLLILRFSGHADDDVTDLERSARGRPPHVEASTREGDSLVTTGRSTTPAGGDGQLTDRQPRSNADAD